MKNKEKPIYEEPKIMRLDDSTEAIGGVGEFDCDPAGSAAGGHCRNGGTAGDECDAGSTGSV